MEPSGTKWNQLEPSGTKWNQVETSGTKWNQVETSGNKWKQVETSGTKWKQVEPSGTKWNQLEPIGTKWKQVEPSGNKWNQVEPSGTKWNQVETSGNKWKQVEGPGPAQVKLSVWLYGKHIGCLIVDEDSYISIGRTRSLRPQYELYDEVVIGGANRHDSSNVFQHVRGDTQSVFKEECIRFVRNNRCQPDVTQAMTCVQQGNVA